MRDANRTNAPLIINSGMRLDREFFPDGTPKNPGDGPETRKRRKTVYRDPYGREGGTFEESDAVHHRPHFGDADRSASETARAQLISDTASAWRSPESNQHVADSVSDASPPAGVSASEWARHQRMLQDAEAWRTPTPTFDAGPEVAPWSKTRAVPDRPQGAWGPAGFAAKAGDPCTKDGAPGVLRERDGWLYCELTRLGPSRSSETVPVDRATIVGDRSAQDAAWRELQERTNSEWRAT
jgi:hypothetical protein